MPEAADDDARPPSRRRRGRIGPDRRGARRRPARRRRRGHDPGATAARVARRGRVAHRAGAARSGGARRRRRRRGPERRQHRALPLDLVVPEHAAVVADHSHAGDRARACGSSVRMLPLSSRRRPSATTARRRAAPHRERGTRRVVPGRSVRRVGVRRPRRGRSDARRAAAHGADRPPRRRAQAAAAAHAARPQRPDRPRHAGVAVDLARGRGRRDPARDRSRHHRPGQPHADRRGRPPTTSASPSRCG